MRDHWQNKHHCKKTSTFADGFFMVGQVGLEPTKEKPTRLQCVAIAARRLPHMVTRAGFEPGITALKGLCPDRLDERTVFGDACGNRTRIFSLRG